MKVKPQHLNWQPLSVAKTWPEGSTVLMTTADAAGNPQLDNSNILHVTTHFRPDLAAHPYCDSATVFVLLKLPTQ